MTEKKKAVSVILPVKDGDLVQLKKAVDSVKRQSYQNYEIILINDGSGETFSSGMEEIAKQDEKIRYFSIPASGVSEARNFGIDKSQGEYITFLDGDDILCPNFFEEAVSYMEETKADALFGGTRYIYAGEREREEASYEQSLENVRCCSIRELLDMGIALTKDRIHLSRAESVGEPYRFRDGGYINRGIAARFIRASFFENGKNRFFKQFHFYEDAIWNLHLIQNGNVHYVTSVWYLYFENPKSVSNRFNPEVTEYMEEPLKMLREILDLSDDTEYRAYTAVLMDSLRYVYKCLLGHKEWNADNAEKRKLRKHLMKDEPWTEIAEKRYLKLAAKKDRVKAYLYKFGMLFLYWRILG